MLRRTELSSRGFNCNAHAARGVARFRRMKVWVEREERPPMFTKDDTRAVVSVYVNGQSRPALTMDGLGPCSLSFVVYARAREQTEQREFFDGVFGLTALDASRAARSELFDGLATRV